MPGARYASAGCKSGQDQPECARLVSAWRTNSVCYGRAKDYSLTGFLDDRPSVAVTV
jgi:hypothetical protein